MAETPGREPEPDYPAPTATQDESPRPYGRGLEANRGLAEQPSPKIAWVSNTQQGTSSIPVEWCIGRLNFAKLIDRLKDKKKRAVARSREKVFVMRPPLDVMVVVWDDFFLFGRRGCFLAQTPLL